MPVDIVDGAQRQKSQVLLVHGRASVPNTNICSVMRLSLHGRRTQHATRIVADQTADAGIDRDTDEPRIAAFEQLATAVCSDRTSEPRHLIARAR